MRIRLLLLLTSLVIGCPSYAQGTLGGNFVTEEFPQVSFIWHENNPERLDSTDFQSFSENGVHKNISVQEISVQIPENENRHVIVLWEDLAYYGANMYDFAKSVITGFLNDYEIKTNERIGIYSYNRRPIDAESYLTDITGGFVSDKDRLLSSIAGYRRNMTYYRDFPNRADIFPAVSEAINLLQKQEEGVKAIIVLTSGYPLDNSSSSSDVNARLLAEKHHVPVYFLQHGRDHGYSAKLSDFAPLTFGSFTCFADIDQRKNISSAIAAMTDIFVNMSQRYHGRDYCISFTSEAKRGGDTSLLEFTINGYEYKEQFIPPAATLGSFIKDHVILSCLIFLCLAGVVTSSVLLYSKRRREEKQRYDELKAENERVQSDAREAISSAEDRFNRKMEAAKKAEEDSRLYDLMRKRNLYPRLICSKDNDVTNHTISKVCTIIGRDPSSDIVLNDKRVSRKHAMISFNGTSFELADTGSTNGVFLNGNIVSDPVPLKDGDRINMGGVMITFYI